MSQNQPLRVVHLEDDPHDVILVEEALSAEGLALEIVHVNTRDAFVAALGRGTLDVILSDYALPGFDGLSALALARQLAPDAPFILVSGTLGEEAAIESLRNGATDYVLKHRLSRLAPAVMRAIQEARERRTRHDAERMLLRERTFLRALLDSLDAGVLACDQAGVPTFFSRAARELYALGDEPAAGEPWANGCLLLKEDARTPVPEGEEPLRRALRGEYLRHAEFTIVRANGTTRTVAVSGQPIVDESGQRLGAVVAMQDITEKKRLERQFHQAQKMEAMGRLAAGVAHDFNNLLTVISGYCQLAMRRVPEEHPLRRDLDEIAKAGEKSANLTRQLLAFSRQQVLRPSPLDLNAVIAELEKMLRRVIGADVELVFSPGTSLGRVHADAGQIEQVLMNLIVNARDAMPRGGRITIDTENVEVGPGAATSASVPPIPGADWGGASPFELLPGRYVMLRVTDTGTGMDPEVVARVFEPFFTTKEAGRGTGLGLSTVLGIVTQSQGHITIASEPGRGSSFHVFFPRTAIKSAAPPVPEAVVPGRGSETILVVDDDHALRALVIEILTAHGYTAIEAGEGETALRLIENPRQSLQALVTDIVMPRLSGRVLAERALAIRPGVSIVFMSGYAGEDVEAIGELLSPTIRFIQKPFAPDLLLLKLRDALDGSAAEAA